MVHMMTKDTQAETWWAEAGKERAWAPSGGFSRDMQRGEDDCIGLYSWLFSLFLVYMMEVNCYHLLSRPGACGHESSNGLMDGLGVGCIVPCAIKGRH